MQPICVRLVAPNSYQLAELLQVEVRRWRVTLLEGFTCDSLSKPKALWGIMGCPFGGEDTLAGFVHDALYRSRLLNQKDSDKIFHTLLLREGVNPIKAKAMYLAVRKFGAEHYGQIVGAHEYRNFVIVEAINS